MKSSPRNPANVGNMPSMNPLSQSRQMGRWDFWKLRQPKAEKNDRRQTLNVFRGSGTWAGRK